MAAARAGRIIRWFIRTCRSGQALLLFFGLTLTAAVAVLLIVQPRAIREAELRLYDLQLRGRTTAPQSSLPLLVGVDEASLGEYGQWPWPRYRLAQLVERLYQLGAEVVVLDILMPEPDRTSPEVILAERQRDRIEHTAAPPLAPDSNSMRLARALGQGNSVLGYYLDFSGTVAPAGQVPGLALPEGVTLVSRPGVRAGWPQGNGEIRSRPQLVAAARAEGFTNALHDFDGILRRVPLLLPQADGERLSLALAAVLLATPERQLHLLREGQETVLAWRGRRIPLDEQGNLLLDFRGEVRPFPYLSARNILHDETPGLDLRGRIVLVGAWAKGIGDVHQIPSGRAVHGLEVHATIIDNLLAGSFIVRPVWARGAELLAVLLLGMGLTLLLSRAGFRLSLLALPLSLAACYGASSLLLIRQGLYLSPLLPMLAAVVITSVLSLLKYGIEVRKVQQRTRELLDAHDSIIIGMSALAEARDQETGRHLLRTQRYVGLLARQLSSTPKYAYLQANDIDLLAKSAPLHDIGKVGIPDSILHKPGKLTEAEFQIMRTHPLIGAEALTRVVAGGGHPERNRFLNYARQMIESHHERWDGAGYPHHLRGEEIPLPGRLMALADVYDALVSRRVYKEGMSHQEVRAFIVDNAGSHFDPDVVAAFVATEASFIAVASQYADDVAPANAGA
ncbi:MAG: Metal-dependent phosphohydrolase, subdomain:CHASE2 [Proteobacteria bacterium]|nr:Metal-dependent phosphohydrolase, subdomain:CHASE2 [Pseudomonadota bacterium]